MKHYIPLILLIVLGLNACDPFAAEQIQARADADQKAIESQQFALNQEQARQQAADIHNWKMADEARIQARKNALEPAKHAMFILAIYAVSLTILTMFVYGTLRVGHTTIIQFNRVQEGFATALIAAAELRARLIYMDPNTRQFPLVKYEGHGKYTLTDPNTKVTMLLDTRNEGDAQMIAGAIAIRHSGMLVMEQRKSGARDAGSMAKVTPPVIEGTAIDVKTIMKDLVKKGWDDE